MGMLDDPAVLEELLRKALTTQETKPNWSTGMLAAGLGMLANNRGNFGEAFGRGGLMGLQAMQDDRQRQQRDPMQQLQMAQTVMGMQGQLADRRGVQDFQGFVGAQPNVTREAMMRYLGHDSAKVREMAKTYLEQMEKGRKLKDTRTLTQDGQRVTVNFFDDGSTEVVPFAPDKEKLSFQGAGGQTLGLDPYTGAPVTQYKHTPTPGDEMTDVRSREQFVTTEQRQRDEMRQRERQHGASLAQSAAQHRENMGKPQFQVTDSGVLAIDPRTATARPVMGEDGRPIENVKAPTEIQARAQMFGSRMESATKIMNDLEAKAGFNPTSPLNLMAGASGASTPLNYLASKDAQSYSQARKNWSEAELRFKTGAAVTEKEIEDNVKIYFPQPGDSKEMVQQKAMARQQAEAAMRAVGGRRQQQTQLPSPQDMVEELRKRGVVR